MDKTRHRKVKYIKGKIPARIAMNKPRFISLTELGDDFYECEENKEKIKLDLPIVLGFFILQYAKLRMLEFYYDFVDRFIAREDYELAEMDTDSLYLALSGENLEAVIKKEYLPDFRDRIYNNCTDDAFEADESNWFPRECCAKHIAFDKRTPGLFKREAEGSEMISLSSKTYVLKESSDSYKLSCKGINKSRVDDPIDIFRSVLNTKETVHRHNIGFRARNNSVWTFLQERAGFGYLYCKREVLEDGVRTKPLALTLTPWRDYNTHCFHPYSPLGMLYPCSLRKYDQVFGSAAHLYNFEKAMGNASVVVRNAVKAAKNPVDAAKLGSKIKLTSKWYDRRDDVMENVLNLKLEQHPKVLTYLENVKGKRLVCIDNFDGYWGCGHEIKVAQLTDPECFAGQNKLGYIWNDIAEQYFREYCI